LRGRPPETWTFPRREISRHRTCSEGLPREHLSPHLLLHPRADGRALYPSTLHLCALTALRERERERELVADVGLAHTFVLVEYALTIQRMPVQRSTRERYTFLFTALNRCLRPFAPAPLRLPLPLGPSSVCVCASRCRRVACIRCASDTWGGPCATRAKPSASSNKTLASPWSSGG